MEDNSGKGRSGFTEAVPTNANDGCQSADLASRYDHIYSRVDSSEHCPVSTTSLTKARSRIRQVLGGFGLRSRIRGARVLDIGSGLGVTAEAFRELGATVTGMDLSPVAVAQAKARFDQIDFRCKAFPEGLTEEDKFDLIWVVDLPIVGLFETENIQATILEPCLKQLKPDGHLIVGWHTNFSGRLTNGWMNWSLDSIRELRRVFRASPALVPQARFFWLSALVCQVCRLARRSAPIYFCVRANAWRQGSAK